MPSGTEKRTRPLRVLLKSLLIPFFSPHRGFFSFPCSVPKTSGRSAVASRKREGGRCRIIAMSRLFHSTSSLTALGAKSPELAKEEKGHCDNDDEDASKT